MLRSTRSSVGLNAAFLKEIKDDHQELHRLMDEAVAWLASSHGNSPVNTRQQETRDENLSDGCDGEHRAGGLLRRLQTQLRTHFRLEEDFGYFADAVKEQPWLGNQAAELQAEHRPLLEKMDDLVRTAHSAASQPKSDSQLQMRFQQFLQDFRRHEDDEIDLIMRAFNDEIGVGD